MTEPDPDLNDAVVGDAGDDAIPLCPHCLHEIDSTTQLCANCTAPVGAFATYDPFKQIASTGWMYRKAISEGTSGYAFAGIWLIFGPTFLLVLASLCAMPIMPIEGSPGGMGPWSFCLFLAAIHAIVLVRVTRSYLRTRRRREGYCARCGYDLRGLPAPRCPECGRRFDPSDAPEGSEDPT